MPKIYKVRDEVHEAMLPCIIRRPTLLDSMLRTHPV